jgi:hypothetical protein
MRRLPVLFLIMLVACNGAAGDATTTSSPPASATSTSIALPATTTTTAPPSTTTTTAATTSTLALEDTVLAYQEVADLPFPVQVTARPGETMSYVITKDGLVLALAEGEVAAEPVLDISGQVRNEGERGLLSIALHPTDPGLFYLHYSDGNGDTVVSEFALTSPGVADPVSERVLLQVDQPASNHNGGMLQFAGGELLLGLGDGGGAGDRFGNGQNPNTVLGGLVAIDVSAEEPNPSKFAMGLRNPWRFWIDDTIIYIADVGQGAFEEINAVALESGLNFGWPITEGLHCFNPPSDCDTAGQVVPVHEVEHGDAGTCSITGGIVYRGSAIPQLTGHYFYSDYCGGYLRSLFMADGEATDLRDWTGQVGVPGQVTGFGVDGAGEMYVTTTEQLLQVVPAG